jgi:hypothetical protein
MKKSQILIIGALVAALLFGLATRGKAEEPKVYELRNLDALCDKYNPLDYPIILTEPTDSMICFWDDSLHEIPSLLESCAYQIYLLKLYRIMYVEEQLVSGKDLRSDIEELNRESDILIRRIDEIEKKLRGSGK